MTGHLQMKGAMMLDFSQRVNIPDNILLSKVANESVILNLDSEVYYGLDEIGTSLWETLVDSESIQRAYESLLDDYDIDERTFYNDLIKFIEDLVGYGLLELDHA